MKRQNNLSSMSSGPASSISKRLKSSNRFYRKHHKQLNNKCESGYKILFLVYQDQKITFKTKHKESLALFFNTKMLKMLKMLKMKNVECVECIQYGSLLNTSSEIESVCLDLKQLAIDINIEPFLRKTSMNFYAKMNKDFQVDIEESWVPLSDSIEKIIVPRLNSSFKGYIEFAKLDSKFKYSCQSETKSKTILTIELVVKC